jgi:hypothetical protein
MGDCGATRLGDYGTGNHEVLGKHLQGDTPRNTGYADTAGDKIMAGQNNENAERGEVHLESWARWSVLLIRFQASAGQSRNQAGLAAPFGYHLRRLA